MSDIPYEDAIDLLDADHKMVQQQFIDYQPCARTKRQPSCGNSWPERSAPS